MAKRKSRINESKYVLTALCYLLFRPLIALGILILLFGAFILNNIEFPLESKTVLTTGGTTLGIGIFTALVFFVNSQSVICRLCRAQFFKRLKCSRKKDVPSIAGSVRIPLALAVVTRRSSICCPYCAEKSVYFEKRKK